ncbi:MAG TPA: hypothetical protein VF768_06795, partial [Holophagaceae bacterium]
MRFRSLTCLLAAGVALSAQALTPRFVSFPDVHGDRVVFTWEDDLWLGSLKGGEARRLTTHPGVETMARFSPDGKWIAFSAQYDGGLEVYVMPSEGGAPKRLTFRGPAQVDGWTPDSAKVLFHATYESNQRPIDRLYAVDLAGHEPEPLPLAKAVQGAFSPDGSKLAFSTKGIPDYYWKRYKGGRHQDLWIG